MPVNPERRSFKYFEILYVELVIAITMFLWTKQILLF